jgi:proline iminopeptidase
MNVAPLSAWPPFPCYPRRKAGMFVQSGHLPSYEEPDKYIEVLEIS